MKIGWWDLWERSQTDAIKDLASLFLFTQTALRRQKHSLRQLFVSLVATIAELSSENQNFTIEANNICVRALPTQQAITGRQYREILPTWSMGK